MFKKKVLITILALFSSVVFCDNWISLGEISFVCPENVYIAAYDGGSVIDYGTFRAAAKSANKNLLVVKKFSFEEFKKYMSKQKYHELAVSSNFQVYKQNCLKTGKWFEDGPAEYNAQKVYEKNNLIYATSYCYSGLWYVSSIGSYQIAIFTDNSVYFMEIVFTQNTGDRNDKIFKALKKYLYLANPGMKLGDGPGEQREGWMFKDEKGCNIENLYGDIAAMRTGVPELTEFQQQYETIVNSIKNMRIRTAVDNLRVRKSADLSAETLVSIKKGEKVIFIEKMNKVDTIEGISDFWYKVRVPAGTLDKDGNKIADDVVGCCFAGFLKE